MVRTEYAKRIRKQYESGLIHHGYNEHRVAEPRTDGCINTLSTVMKDNLIAEPVIAASRGRNPENPSDRRGGIHLEQRLELGGSICNTLTTVTKDNYVYEVHQMLDLDDELYDPELDGEPAPAEPKVRIRKLTPKECLRLMDFPDEAADAILDTVSNTQAYKQAGNSIVVSVLYNIFKEMC